MSSDRPDAERPVSGTEATIPTRIRREFGVGDRLRWRIEDDGTVRVEVVDERSDTFERFDGYDGTETTDVTADHDVWGVA